MLSKPELQVRRFNVTEEGWYQLSPAFFRSKRQALEQDCQVAECTPKKRITLEVDLIDIDAGKFTWNIHIVQHKSVEIDR